MCRGKVIYVACSASGKINPSQRAFCSPTTCSRINTVPGKMHFTSRSRGQLTNVTQNQALPLLTTSQYSSGKHVGHRILPHPVWLQFLYGYKFIRETDCKQTGTHTRKNDADRFCLLTLHRHDCLTQKPEVSPSRHRARAIHVTNPGNPPSASLQNAAQHLRGDCGSLVFAHDSNQP